MLFRRVAMMLSLVACLMSPTAASAQPEVPELDEGTNPAEPGNGATAKFAASSQPPAIMSAAPGRRAEQWRERRYGGTMFLVDASAAIIGGIVQASTGSDIGAGIFVGGYFLSGAITHGYHGNWGTAGLSVLNRAGLPLAGGAVGLIAGTAACGNDDPLLAGGIIGSYVGFAMGAAGALALDWFVLARDHVEIPDSDASRTVVIPNVFVGDHQVGVGFQGVF